MSPVRTVSSVFTILSLSVLAACGPSADQPAVEGTPEAAPATPMAQAPAPGQSDFSCFLRGATMEEAEARPSPRGQTTFTLNGQEGLLCYGRPSANDRVVMGELVPYGAPWRLGADEATAIYLPVPARIGSVDVEPGAYSLYAVPAAGEWEIVVNSQVERWGIPINDGVTAANIGSFTRPTAATPSMVEQLTISWDSHGEGMGHLVIDWENTRVEVPVEAR